MVKALGLVTTWVLLSSFNHCQILLSQEIDNDFVWLVFFKGSKKHLDKYAELFKVACLVSNFFNVLLFVVASPDQSLRLRLNVQNYAALGIKCAHAIHG